MKNSPFLADHNFVCFVCCTKTMLNCLVTSGVFYFLAHFNLINQFNK